MVQLPTLELFSKIVVRLPHFGVGRPIKSDPIISDVNSYGGGVKARQILVQLPTMELSYLLLIRNLKETTVDKEFDLDI